jgi:cell division transport system permease protein
MSANAYKFSKRRARTSAISTIVGISLVLFMLGILTLIVLSAQKITQHIKENITVQVFLKEDAKDADVMFFKKSVDTERYVRTSEYITKETAAKELQEELGEDFITFLGYNPLTPSINVKLNAQYANLDSVGWIEKQFMANNVVKEVVYHPDLIRQIDQNINKISIIILAFSVLLFIIAIALINNTIRLSIYSKRLIIRSMQLVGATKSFIQKPFIMKGIMHGVYASIIAIALICAVIYFVQNEIPEFFELQDAVMFAKLFGIVVLLGLLISGVSTFLAVRKYLRMNSDQIF